MSRKKKNIETRIYVDSYAADGKCVGVLEDGKKVFVDKVVPGDTALIRIVKNKKHYAEARLIEIIEYATDRVTPFCEHFGVCGGCKWQMLPYSKQLAYKQQQVADQMTRIGHLDLPPIETILGSEQQRFYRNKLEFTFSSKKYRTNLELQEAKDTLLTDEQALGFHAPGLFDKVVPISYCHLQPEPSNKILNTLRHYSELHQLPYYDFKTHKGYLRNVIIRVLTTSQILVNIVFNSDMPEVHIPLLDFLLHEIPEITSLCYTINTKFNDTIYDLEVKTYYGNGYVTERLENYEFKISPKSFFQTNTKQAEVLYNVVRDFANLTGNEVVYDLYCGTGSIGIFCSQSAKKIIGIEAVAEAIEDAQWNAEKNGVQNTAFYAGDVGDICTDEFFKVNGKPDVIITDPPRVGMSDKLIQQLLKLKVPKIVYVSCNPATQARDLAILQECYKIIRMRPVDMFPHTQHIENVVLLNLKS